jgi:hypothetical protein
MNQLRFLFLDAETYWTKEYSLSKLTNEEYVRHPLFKVHGWGVMPLGGTPRWLTEDQFKYFIKTVDWNTIAVVCHNTRFDGAILGWHYGLRPRLWVDTMGMYRALHPELKSHSMAALGRHFGHGIKGNSDWSRGIRDLTPQQWYDLGVYCATGEDSDCRITQRLFAHAWHRFPPFERAVMDMTLRMFIEPVLHTDADVLQKFLKEHVEEKRVLLERSNLTREDVMSNDKFATALRTLGVEPPMKFSPKQKNPDGSPKLVYAFAKTDEGMDQLVAHPDPRVQIMAAARLGNKSTILETRANHLIRIGERGTLPIPLNYWGAKVTGRHSGGDDINMQNFKRGSVLRRGVKAPPGHMIVVGDSSNIELRLVMALAGQWDQIEKIRHYDSIPEDERVTDLYCDFASDVYGRTVTKDDEDERFVGKQGMLSLQYMASGGKYHNMLRIKFAEKNAQQRKKNPQWVDKEPPPLEEAERHKDVYRRKHHRVKKLWYYCEQEVIPAIANRQVGVPVDVNGWFRTVTGGFALPGELGVQYPGLRHGLEDGWSYDSGRGRRSLYGAKVVENICQHAARQVVMYQGLLVRTRYPVVHSVHDELVSCVLEEDAEDCAAFMLQCLSTAPKWAQGMLPVTGEVGIGRSYGEAK